MLKIDNYGCSKCIYIEESEELEDELENDSDSS
jgi:hypothetical protein